MPARNGSDESHSFIHGSATHAAYSPASIELPEGLAVASFASLRTLREINYKPVHYLRLMCLGIAFYSGIFAEVTAETLRRRADPEFFSVALRPCG